MTTDAALMTLLLPARFTIPLKTFWSGLTQARLKIVFQFAAFISQKVTTMHGCFVYLWWASRPLSSPPLLPASPDAIPVSKSLGQCIRAIKKNPYFRFPTELPDSLPFPFETLFHAIERRVVVTPRPGNADPLLLQSRSISMPRSHGGRARMRTF